MPGPVPCSESSFIPLWNFKSLIGPSSGAVRPPALVSDWCTRQVELGVGKRRTRKREGTMEEALPSFHTHPGLTAALSDLGVLALWGME